MNSYPLPVFVPEALTILATCAMVVGSVALLLEDVTLLERLADEGYRVSLETSGALDVSQVDPRVSKVMDLKTPGSGECDRNRMANLQWLGSDDALKFVICDRSAYEWSREQVRTLSADCEVFFSPSWGQLEAADLADWLIEDRLPVRMQVQLHKVLWGDEPGR